MKIFAVLFLSIISSLLCSSAKAQYTYSYQIDGLSAPYQIASDSNGNVYVAEQFGDRVSVFNNGTRLGSIGTSGSGAGQLKDPRGVAVNQDGFIAIADSGNHRVQIFDANRNFVRQFGSQGLGDGQFNQPETVTFDRFGDVYVSDPVAGRIQVLGIDGQYKRSIFNAGFARSTAIRNDELYVADQNPNTIRVFNAFNGMELRNFQTASTLLGVAVDDAGDIFVTVGGSTVQQYDSLGNPKGIVGLGSGSGNGEFNGVSHLSFISPNTLAVSDVGNSRVQFFTKPVVVPELSSILIFSVGVGMFSVSRLRSSQKDFS